jgi:hypothetical protein
MTYGAKFDHASFVRSVGKLLGALEKRGITDSERVRMKNAFSYAGMQAGGVTHVICRSRCEEHKHLDGKVLPIGEAFIDGAKHPPFGKGCTCELEAVK